MVKQIIVVANADVRKDIHFPNLCYIRQEYITFDDFFSTSSREGIFIIDMRDMDDPLFSLPAQDNIYIAFDDVISLTKYRQLMHLGFREAFEMHEMSLLHQYIETIVHDSFQQLNKPSIRLDEQHIAYMKFSLAYDLIYGNIKNIKSIWDRYSLTGSMQLPNIVLLVHIDDFAKMVERKSEQWEYTIRKHIMDTIDQFFTAQKLETITVTTGADKIAILYSANVQAYEYEYFVEMKELATKLRQYVFDQTQYSLTIGISNYYSDVRNLHMAYEEAFLAQEQKFYEGKQSIVHISEIQQTYSTSKLIFDLDVSILCNKLIIGDIEGIQDEYSILEKKLFTKSTIQPNLFKIVISNIVVTLCRATMEGGVDSLEIIKLYNEIEKELPKLENIAEIQQWMRQIIHFLIQALSKAHSSKTSGSINRAIQFIEKNYCHGITLEEVAETVQLTPNYFSNAFKKVTKHSFIEYITNLRIQRAKELLLKLNLSISDVSNQIGYYDSRYFSRVFKNIVGKTPSQYRNMMLKNEKV
ncbi:AraC family transcriptional regulator [Lysinibacillus sp. LZ02]|uniref:AraC family transcriptional regulator n=1 Tax=Lysinibacillus sp. LZ02 TaxID=3420668 RepID=UPI003D369774